jgi:hypothetical protein
MAMTDKEYWNRLSEKRQSRKNDIIRAVNYGISKENAGLADEVEERFYDDLVKEADELEARYGTRPVFELGEIDYDDPILDIYSEPAEVWAERHRKTGSCTGDE